jgi:hypothetical protein
MSHFQRFLLTMAAVLAYFVALFLWPLIVGLGTLALVLAVYLLVIAWALTE